MAYIKSVVNETKVNKISEMPPQGGSIFSSIPNVNMQNLTYFNKELSRRRLSAPTTSINDAITQKRSEIIRRHSIDNQLENENKYRNEPNSTLQKSTISKEKDTLSKSPRSSNSRIETLNKARKAPNQSNVSSIPNTQNFNKQNLTYFNKELSRRRLSAPTTSINDIITKKRSEIIRRHSMDNQLEIVENITMNPMLLKRSTNSRNSTSNKAHKPIKSNSSKTLSPKQITLNDSLHKETPAILHGKSLHQTGVSFKNYLLMEPKSNEKDNNNNIYLDFAQRCLTSQIESGKPLESYGILTTTNVRQGRYHIDDGSSDEQLEEVETVAEKGSLEKITEYLLKKLRSVNFLKDNRDDNSDSG